MAWEQTQRIFGILTLPRPLPPPGYDEPDSADEEVVLRILPDSAVQEVVHRIPTPPLHPPPAAQQRLVPPPPPPAKPMPKARPTSKKASAEKRSRSIEHSIDRSSKNCKAAAVQLDEVMVNILRDLDQFARSEIEDLMADAGTGFQLALCLAGVSF